MRNNRYTYLNENQTMYCTNCLDDCEVVPDGCGDPVSWCCEEDAVIIETWPVVKRYARRFGAFHPDHIREVVK